MSKYIMIIAANACNVLVWLSANETTIAVYVLGSFICIGIFLILSKLQK